MLGQGISPPVALMTAQHHSFCMQKRVMTMDGLLLLLGRAAGFAGVLLCVVAAVARLIGTYWLAGFQLGTLMQAGIAGVVIGCFLLLVAQGRTGASLRSRR
jgi:hypothetical protein